MAAQDRGQTPDLRSQLLTEGRRFSFVQAMRLLRLLMRNRMGSEVDEHEIQQKIRVRPELSLAFPETDVASIQEMPGEAGGFLITASFMGLYGTASPLPTFYTEDLLQEQSNDRSISRDFIDIINVPIYAQYFKAWSRCRLHFKIAEETDATTLDRLYCLLGLESAPLRNRVDDAYGLLRYIGLVTQFPRSAEGLRAMLTDGLDEPTVRIIPCVERTAAIPEDQRFILGRSGNGIGKTAYLGGEIADRIGKFRVRLGPLDIEAFERLLPDTPLYRKMKNLIRFYLDQPLDWDVEAELRPAQIETACLGGPCWSKLGWNTWVFAGYAPMEEASVRFSDREGHA